MTNNDDVKQFFKTFYNYDTEKGFLMMVPKQFKKVY